MTKEIPFTDLTYSDRALRIAKRIQQHPENFNMQDFIEGEGDLCDTTYCIAGWAMAEAGYSDNQIVTACISERTTGVEEIAAGLLGLDKEAASNLFLETEATLEDAVACLENLAATGKVEWPYYLEGAD